jgi:HK97 family phage prohead protease
MTTKRETRKAEIRAATVDGKPGVTLQAITTGVVDDYGSWWMPDAFDESLEQRLPTLCWSHDWSEPLGPATGFRTGDTGPEIDFSFSDFDAVPMARRAHAQVGDGTIRDCSVGFFAAQRRDPTPEEEAQYPGIREVILKAQLDEVSLVLRGAVPGAKVLAMRAGKIAVDAAVDLARRVQDGEITSEQAKAALDLLATDDPGEGVHNVNAPSDPPAPDHEALDAEVDALLAGRSRR